MHKFQPCARCGEPTEQEFCDACEYDNLAARHEHHAQVARQRAHEERTAQAFHHNHAAAAF